jgi:class 3 adenylate cyclase/predicted ATPase
LSALENLNAESLARTGAVIPPQTQAPPSVGAASDGAERRPITVMFCDLVGSTSLAAKLDAEEWRNLVNAYLDQASAAVTDLGGHVLKKLGDGLMALFGYPRAQENDAERAVRAALAIQRALVEINARNGSKGTPELSARIGLDSGPVVVDATGEVFGEAPNVAARVQAAAEPGIVLVTATVQRQVAGLFVVEDKGAHDLKGVLAPVGLYRVVRASGGGRRGGARALTSLVGREDELALLARRWSRALEGEGQFVQIVGEPGIGKSRLIEEFRTKLAETPHTWVEWAASQLLQNTPLHPLAEWGRLRFGGADATEEGRLADLENTLRLIGLDPEEHAPLIAPLIDIPLPEERSAKFAPEELRRRQLAAVTAWYFAGARTQPAVLVFEDLHWADPTSLDLLRSLAERGAQAPLLIVATTRPEFRADWNLRSHHSVISLAPLDRAQVRRMVSEIAASHGLPEEMVDGVGERTGGVPLFVEEVTRLLLERGAAGGAQTIPPTLQQSLAARLDRLGEAREVAQIGAVLGRDFSYRLLCDVSSSAAGFDELRLQAALDRLTEADLLFVDGAPPTAAYRFKHALIQDAAYDSLLKSRRQALHRRAAEALRHANAEPEAIAHHFTQAALDDLAIEWWGRAGDQALRRSAFQEAIAHLGKAIAMADKGPVGSVATVPKQSLLKLQTNYAQALVWSKGFAAEETRAAFERTGDLATRAELPAERFPALYGQYLWNLQHGDISSARQIAEHFLQEAEAQGRAAETGVGHRLVGLSSTFLGELVKARTHLEAALKTYDQERDSEVREKFAHDTGVAAAAFLALASWLTGDLERARQLIEEAMSLGSDLGHLPSAIHALWYRVYIQCLRNDPKSVAVDAENLLRTSQQHGVELFVMLADVARIWARGRLGDARSGAIELRRSLADYLRQGNRLWVPTFQALLADLEAGAGEVERALARIDEGLATAQEGGQNYTDAFLYRLRGDLLLKLNPGGPEPAAAAYKTAVDVSEHQGMRTYRLLASLSLAKLHQSVGCPAEAHAVLAPALEGFSPTPEMPEIAEAQALLAALAETDEVKDAAASRHRRLQLQTRYGQAMMYSRGYASDESRTAFVGARTLAAGVGNASERFDAYYGLLVGSVLRGELSLARETAESFLRDADNEGRMMEAAVARRCVGLMHLLQGDFIGAEANLAEALRRYDPERDRDAKFRFGADGAALASGFLAQATRALGDVERARALGEEALARADETAHAPTRALVYHNVSLYQMLCRDPENVWRTANIPVELGRDHGMALYLALGDVYSNWARARLGDRQSGIAALREGLATYLGQGNKLFAPLFQGRLAELEAEGDDADGALTRIDCALALANDTEEHWTDALLHGIRGEILLKHEPRDPAPAEEAFLAALAVAQTQKARSFELQAALSLARLYQSTGRPVDAHAVLAPALEGFSPTPEMPQIAEAQTLLGELSTSVG